MLKIYFGIMIPFFGTLLGTGCVLFMRDTLSRRVRVCLLGFAGGIMTAASVWSLIIPAIEYSSALGTLAFVPAAVGFFIGVAFLLVLGKSLPKFLRAQKSTAMLTLAVGLHNIPEGMAVGAVFAAILSGGGDAVLGGAFALALGIAIQNIPEGAIVSMPLKADGKSRLYALGVGFLSGAVEPLGAVLTLYAVGHILPLLPYLLGFAAGAMIYVAVNELLPEMEADTLGTLMYCLGFSVMMTLDVALG